MKNPNEKPLTIFIDKELHHKAKVESARRQVSLKEAITRFLTIWVRGMSGED